MNDPILEMKPSQYLAYNGVDIMDNFTEAFSDVWGYRPPCGVGPDYAAAFYDANYVVRRDFSAPETVMVGSLELPNVKYYLDFTPELEDYFQKQDEEIQAFNEEARCRELWASAEAYDDFSIVRGQYEGFLVDPSVRAPIGSVGLAFGLALENLA